MQIAFGLKPAEYTLACSGLGRSAASGRLKNSNVPRYAAVRQGLPPTPPSSSRTAPFLAKVCPESSTWERLLRDPPFPLLSRRPREFRAPISIPIRPPDGNDSNDPERRSELPRIPRNLVPVTRIPSFRLVSPNRSCIIKNCQNGIILCVEKGEYVSGLARRVLLFRWIFVDLEI